MKSKSLNIAFFLIGLIMLIFLVWDFGFDNIVSNVAKTGWWLLPITGIWLVIYIMNTAAWLVILGKIEGVSFKTLLQLTISGFSINYITPVVGLAGEPYKVINMQKSIGIEKATSSIILYNMMHILSHFFFWITAIILITLSSFWNIVLTGSTYISMGIVLLVLSLMIWVFYVWHKKGVVYSMLRFFGRFPFLKKMVNNLYKKETTLTNIENQVIDLYNNRRGAFYKALALEYFARIVGALEFYFIMQAISVDIGILSSIYISAASSLIANLFFFIPLQLGTREGSLWLVFESLKFTPALGVFVSFVTRIREFFWILVGLILLRLSSATTKN
jgi:hypothetical protein